MRVHVTDAETNVALGEAWLDAEAALWPSMRITRLAERSDEAWEAVAEDGTVPQIGVGSDPIEALRDLAETLRTKSATSPSSATSVPTSRPVTEATDRAPEDGAGGRS